MDLIGASNFMNRITGLRAKWSKEETRLTNDEITHANANGRILGGKWI